MTDFNSMLNEYNTQILAFNALRAQMANKLKAEFGSIVKGFFEANPIVEGIIWSQYTPYFNDGDECIFNVHERYGVFKAPEGFMGDNFSEMTNGYHAEDSELGISDYSWGEPSAAMIEAYGVEAVKKAHEDFKSLNQALGQIPDDVYKDTFGDHVTIKVSLAGIEIDDCDHD